MTPLPILRPPHGDPAELGAKIWDKDKVVLVIDHYVPEADEESRRVVRIARDWAAEQRLPLRTVVNPDAGALPEPEVTITTKGETLHEEYRLGGRLYMIKVIPNQGRPYYLIDNEGRGEFMRSDFQPSVSPPMWVIKRF